MKRIKLAVIVSHPIQHFAPWHRETAKLDQIDLKVFFCCKWGLESYHDPEFGIPVEWDIPLVDGYRHEFLAIAEPPSRLTFWTVDNPSIVEALEAYNPDVIKVFGYAHRTMWRVRSWARKKRLPLLLYSDSNIKAVNPFWKEILKRQLVKHFYRGVDGALCVGDNNAAFHRSYGLPDERLFPGMLPIDRTLLLRSVPDRKETREKLRTNWGIPKDGCVALFCGKFVPRKRPMDVLQAIGILQAVSTVIYPVFVGEGPERGQMEKFLTEHGLRSALIAGFVNQSTIGQYFAAADFLVVSSEYDPHPLVVTEAGTFGLPVVISDRVGCIGPTDTAQPNVNAVVFRCGDARDLARAMLVLLEKGRRMQMGNEALRISEGQDVKLAAVRLVEASLRLCALGPRKRNAI